MNWIKNTIVKIPRWSAYVLLGVLITVLIIYFAWLIFSFGRA